MTTVHRRPGQLRGYDTRRRAAVWNQLTITHIHAHGLMDTWLEMQRENKTCLQEAIQKVVAQQGYKSIRCIDRIERESTEWQAPLVTMSHRPPCLLARLQKHKHTSTHKHT